MKTNLHYRYYCQRGFTLLELVMVIAILAVLSTVAVRSLTGVASQSRFEMTQRTLDQIREAIVGDANDRQPDGTRVISGFIADMGRLPRAVVVTNSSGVYLTLDELLVKPDDVLPFAVRSATAANSEVADTNVFVAGGWRGPYVRLPVGAEALSDGWGNELANAVPLGPNFTFLSNSNGSPVAEGEAIFNVTSPGADGAENGTNYDRDLSIRRIDANDYIATLSGNIYVLDETNNLVSPLSVTNGSVTVRIYGPDANDDGKCDVIAWGMAGNFTANPISYSFANSLKQGPRTIRAYVTYGGHTYRSSVTYMSIRPGMNIKDLSVDPWQ